jgi:hypothetical protein
MYTVTGDYAGKHQSGKAKIDLEKGHAKAAQIQIVYRS